MQMRTQEAADFFGGRKRLAEALGISPAAVSMWGETIPLTRQYQIQVISKGKLMARERRPA